MKGFVYRLLLVGGLAVGFASWADTLQAAGVAVEQATAAQKKDAQGKFTKAMADYEAKRLDKALEGFRNSYNIVASPNSHYMVARTLRDLNKLYDAAIEYQGVIEEASKDTRYGETLTNAKGEYEELKPRLAFVSIQLQGPAADAKVEVAGKPVEASKLGTPLLVEPGAVSVVVHSAKGELKKTVNASAGKTEAVSFDLGPAQPAPSGQVSPTPGDDTSKVSVDSKKFGLKEWGYVAGGVGVAGLVTFGIFGLMNNSKYNDLDSKCTNGHCPSNLSSDIDTGKTYQTVANIGLVVGIVGLGTGTVLYVLGSKKKPQEQPAATSKTPQVFVGPGSLLVSGQF